MRKYKKSRLPYHPDFRFRKSERDEQLPTAPTARPRRIKRTLIVFGLLASVNVAAALFNPYIGIFASFLLGPAYIILGIILAVYAYTETSGAGPNAADNQKRKKTRLRGTVAALVLIVAVVVFLLLLNDAVGNFDFR